MTSDDFRAYTSAYDKNGCKAYTFTDTSGEGTPCNQLLSDICPSVLEEVSASTYSSIATCSTYNLDNNIRTLLESSSKYH